MRVTIEREVRKLCPFADEVDRGTLRIVWETDDDVPELHELGRAVDGLEGQRLTHEAYTADVRDALPDAVLVETVWHTGPWKVTCSSDAVPLDAVH